MNEDDMLPGYDDSFTTGDNLREFTGNVVGVRNYHCKFCLAVFSHDTQLREHLQNKHNKSYVAICKICGKAFFSSLGYKQHLDFVHFKTEARPGVECKVCGKCVPCQSQLVRHMRRHSSEKLFTCVYCNRSYKHKHDLKVHICKALQFEGGSN